MVQFKVNHNPVKMSVTKATPKNNTEIIFEDDGNGNVTISTTNESMEAVFTDDGNGNVRLEVI